MSTNKIAEKIQQAIKDSYWPGYVHTYPHKRVYTHLGKLDFHKLWGQHLEHVNLYIHVPFCEQRCSYCNIFTTVCSHQERDGLFEKYLDRLFDEIEYYANIVNKDVTIASLYFGGGTPTLLSINQLDSIVRKLREAFANWDDSLEVCIESTPEILSAAYLKGLASIGFKRVSIGVQSFSSEELRDANRCVEIESFRDMHEFAHSLGLNTNIDLIYGLPHQDEESIISNLKKAISFNPETITVYPLAIRELTGIERTNNAELLSMEEKYSMFDKIRDLLESSGYMCQTVTRFIRNEKSTYQQQCYEYQGVPTIGLGAGARSYAPDVHYCMPYMVNNVLANNVFNDYMCKDISEVEYDGFVFNTDEHKRKHIMLNLLHPGLDIDSYQIKFNSVLVDDFKEELDALLELGLIENTHQVLKLTKIGRKYSDIVASVFESEQVKHAYSSYTAK